MSASGEYRYEAAVDLSLEGKVVWITGAGRGLGRSLAFALANAGAEMLLMGRRAEPLEEAARMISERGGHAHVVAGSVLDAAAVANAVGLAESVWGKVDVLVNNAGISPIFLPAERIEDAEWREVLDVNLTGPFLCCKAVLPLMEAAGGGSIVNVSSVHGTSAHERLAAYSVSKAGLEMLTRTLAIEWATKGIRVNCVAPGYLRTDMTAGLLSHQRWEAELLGRIPMNRFGDTGDVVGPVLFLAAEASNYVTGICLPVDGGWKAR